MYLFILSKIPELVDTAFIVVRKRSVITLHWYHHFTVMLFCWHAFGTFAGDGLWFAAMNLTVHAFMYAFYALTALGYRPTKFAHIITSGQIAQMVVGTAVTTYAVYRTCVVENRLFSGAYAGEREAAARAGALDVPAYPRGAWHWWTMTADWPPFSKSKCNVNTVNAVSGWAMYLSYLWLFVVFYRKAYGGKKKGKKGKGKGKGAAGAEPDDDEEATLLKGHKAEPPTVVVEPPSVQ